MQGMRIGLAAVPLFFLILGFCRGQDLDPVKGAWFTEVEGALAQARQARKPVLAVAMDHG